MLEFQFAIKLENPGFSVQLCGDNPLAIMLRKRGLSKLVDRAQTSFSSRILELMSRYEQWAQSAHEIDIV